MLEKRVRRESCQRAWTRIGGWEDWRRSCEGRRRNWKRDWGNCWPWSWTLNRKRSVRRGRRAREANHRITTWRAPSRGLLRSRRIGERARCNWREKTWDRLRLLWTAMGKGTYSRGSHKGPWWRYRKSDQLRDGWRRSDRDDGRQRVKEWGGYDVKVEGGKTSAEGMKRPSWPRQTDHTRSEV